MSIVRHHNEWLSLVPNSGPFLSLPVLKDAFRQGLDAHDADHARRLRVAFHEWDDDQTGRRPDPVIHRAWVKLVLDETLGYADLLAEKQDIPETLRSEIAEYGETLRPDWVVNDPVTKKARVLVQFYPRAQAIGKPATSSRWKASPDTRMMQLLHDTGVRLGIVTNGDHWMLVNAPKNETTGYASWYANLWLEEPVTLRAFRTLLSADRLFSVPEGETLEALLDKSAADQQEVTDQLGYQVRKAVEVLIQALDKADQDHGRKLLADVNEKVLYESALTVMMRLVFLFCAEERELLLLGDELYDENYAVSTLREQLQVTADQFGPELLGLRYDAWVRLLTTFRAVYAGAKHDRLKLPAYGGSLFHPDRFPFLEGRAFDTSWKDTQATPLPVNNRTVLHLLEALQVLQVRLPGGGAPEARKLSFRELNIEQIGHVYEGLLDHTAKRATEPMLGLKGTRDKEPEIALAELERLVAKGEKELLKHLKDETGRSESALKKELNGGITDEHVGRFRTACQDDDLWKRVMPFAGLVRADTVGYPVVITLGSVFVTAGTDRRSSGTHYTPKSLTEPIVQYTLEPLVYVGPAEGLPKEQWRLRPAKELLALKICDMACGSGAFLVQSCRYMAERLLEAWDQDEHTVQRLHQPNLFNPESKPRHEIVRITPYGQPTQGGLYEQLVPLDPDERYTYALRIVAQRCLYGVDKNPLAVEMAKLSLWLLTLAKNMPFEFLDHAIRCGDSLIGIHNLDQLRNFSLDGKGDDRRVVLAYLDDKIKEAVALRRQITEAQAKTVEEVEAQERMLHEANEKIDRLKSAADLLISAEFVPGSATENQFARDDAAVKVAVHFNESDLPTFRREAQKALGVQLTFHWPLEFPEVVVERGGFDAFVGNPPFMFGTIASTILSKEYIKHLQRVMPPWHGKADYVVGFFKRAALLTPDDGAMGLISTSALIRGETFDSGLKRFLESRFRILYARSPYQWPGDAGVEVVSITLRRDWNGRCLLDHREVDSIGPDLSEGSGDINQPEPLSTHNLRGFMGVKLGPGNHDLDSEHVARIRHECPEVDEFLVPAVGGDEINGRSDLCSCPLVVDPERWQRSKDSVPEVALGKLGLERARGYSHARPASDMQQAIAGNTLVFVCGETSVHLAFLEVSCLGVLIKHKAIAFPAQSWSTFAVVSSELHLTWAWRWGLRREARLVYSPKRCATTYPTPDSTTILDGIGKACYLHRTKMMRRLDMGLTDIYNQFHSQKESDADILTLRQLHAEMDNAVAAAYGWTDLDLCHDFHETKQGVRYTISEPARREVLARLLTLNHERYAEEVKKGLHDKKKAKPTSGGSKPAPKTSVATEPVATPGLFDTAVVDTAFPNTDRDKYLCGLLCDLVQVKPGLSADAYVDCLHLARRSDTSLLVGKDRSRFVELVKQQPAVAQSAAPLPWADLLQLLTLRQTLQRANNTFLRVGKKIKQVRADYPKVDSELVRLIHSAAERLRELQVDAKPQPADIQDELRVFVENRRQLVGTAQS